MSNIINVCEMFWKNYILDLGGTIPNASAIWQWIEPAYTEPHRHYHTLEHIEHCLLDMDIILAAEEKFDPHPVEMAIWFHDIVYDTNSHSNEEDSATLARNALGILNVCDETFKNQVVSLIMATKHSSGVPSSKEEAVLLDVDLAILGADPEEFDEYEKNIQKEYNWVPSEIYRQKRAEILESFLARPRLFHTHSFHDVMDKVARDNLRRSIALLKR